MTKPTQWHVRSAKTQISLGIRPVWSESLLSAWRKLGSLATHCAHSEDSDQTGWMPRLIWVFAERTCHFVADIYLIFRTFTQENVYWRLYGNIISGKTYKQQYEKTYLLARASNEEKKIKSARSFAQSDQSLHWGRNEEVFESLAIQNVPSEDSDQTARMSDSIFFDVTAHVLYENSTVQKTSVKLSPT